MNAAQDAPGRASAGEREWQNPFEKKRQASRAALLQHLKDMEGENAPQIRAPQFGTKDLAWAIPSILAALTGEKGAQIGAALAGGALQGKQIGAARDYENAQAAWEREMRKYTAQARALELQAGYDEEDYDRAENDRIRRSFWRPDDAQPNPEGVADAAVERTRRTWENDVRTVLNRALKSPWAINAAGNAIKGLPATLTPEEFGFASFFGGAGPEVKEVLRLLGDQNAKRAPLHSSAAMHKALVKIDAAIQSKAKEAQNLLDKIDIAEDPSDIESIQAALSQLHRELASLEGVRGKLNGAVRNWRVANGVPAGGKEFPKSRVSSKQRAIAKPPQKPAEPDQYRDYVWPDVYASDPGDRFVQLMRAGDAAVRRGASPADVEARIAQIMRGGLA